MIEASQKDCPYTRDEINDALDKLAQETSGVVSRQAFIMCFETVLNQKDTFKVTCERCGAPITFFTQTDLDGTPLYIDYWDRHCSALAKVGIMADMHEFCPNCVSELNLPRKTWFIPSISEEKHPLFSKLLNTLLVTEPQEQRIFEGYELNSQIYMRVWPSFAEKPHYIAFEREAVRQFRLDELAVAFLKGENIFEFAACNSQNEQYRSEALIAGICRFLNIPPSEEVLYRYLELTEKHREHTKD